MSARHGARSRRQWRVRVGALAVLLVAGGAVLGVLVAGTRSVPPGVTSSSAAVVPRVAPSAGAVALQNTYTAVLKLASPSVVEIETSTGLGSGVVYDVRGDIVTNAHVVGSERSFTVLLANGERAKASLVGVFAPDDLAVIRATTKKAVRPALFADSGKLAVGNLVLAIGSPYGLAGSVTEGIVSSTGRSVSEGNGVLLPNTIQTSAPINPGNSGGALVNLSGAVVGIPTLAATNAAGAEASGIGFAIPSNTVKLIVPQLIASGKVTSAGRAALGITGEGVVAGSGMTGVYVAAVTAGGPAARAGIIAGDVITAIAGHTVSSFTDLQTVLAGLQPGRSVTVALVHADGSPARVTAVLGDIAKL